MRNLMDRQMSELERDSQRGIEPEDSTLAYAGENLTDSPDFVPEIATPQEKQAA